MSKVYTYMSKLLHMLLHYPAGTRRHPGIMVTWVYTDVTVSHLWRSCAI